MENVFSYDAVPYPSKTFLQTHPDRLATLATLFGMQPAKIETCRVLELGCGNGFNLVSHAYNLPEASFVGTDLAQNHIETAQNSVRELNLQNIEFHQIDVMEMSATKFGKFDYIIAHGLFSWVPDFVRVKILTLCREMLAENGVGYISYNAFPGARHRQMAQEIMRFHAAHFDEPADKVNRSAAFLAFLTEHAPDRELYAPILQEELKRIFTLQPADIFHDNLSEVNQPFYFHEFAEMLRQNDLQFLAEADLKKMGTQNLSSDARQFVETLENIVEREQYLDFFGGRIFRQTLFCRSEIKLEHNPPTAKLNEFFVASAVRAASEKPELTTEKLEKFAGPKDSSIEINHPLTKAALVHLGDLGGRVTAFPELLETARQTLENQGLRVEDWDEQFEITRTLFLQICCQTGLVGLHVFAPRANVFLSEKPRADTLVRWQSEQADRVISPLNLSLKIEDPISHRLLELLDGTRDFQTLLAELTAFIKTNDEIENNRELLDNLPNLLNERLAQFARLGIFAA